MWQLWLLDLNGNWFMHGFYSTKREAEEARYIFDGFKDFKACRVEV